MIADGLMSCRIKEHRHASDVLCGSDTAAHLALSRLLEIARRRKFVTQSPVRVALVALHHDNLAVQERAAMILWAVASRRTMTALRWKLAEQPHEMIADTIKEALTRAARKRKP